MAQMPKPPTAAVVFELDSMHLLRRVLQDMTCGQRMRACADMPALALQNCSRANVTALVDENLLQFTLAHMAAIDAMPHAYPAWVPELLADLYMRKCISTDTTSAFTAITDIISDVCTYAGASICDLIRGVILRADDPLAVMNLTRTHCARSRKREHSLTHVVQYIDQLYFAT